MENPHTKALDTAFLMLSFAIKLWHYLQEHPINKELFDISLTINAPGNIICLADNEFDSYDDIVLASENNISICFGAATCTLWEALNKNLPYTKGNPNPMNTEEEKLAGLCYMIRCCFAHGTTVPRWQITDRYKTCYNVYNKTIDLTILKNGQPFYYKHIGGYETLWSLRAKASELGLFRIL
ncbi:MAG: hypothetical protein HY889_09420 [Deltaproteobacteria bacterium]|nr:hypothetical protein [Deltaproteobacteria bacterium]